MEPTHRTPELRNPTLIPTLQTYDPRTRGQVWETIGEPPEATPNQLYIPKIKDAHQQLRHLPDQISTAFHDYYHETNQELQRPQRVEDIRRYLDMANIPGIEEVDQEALETSITPEELAYAIKKVKTGGAPGYNTIKPSHRTYYRNY
ncbi:Hypothetical predicted protein [Pelobates cultripes]|uniref:Uncharacterized protein n=1 Tax=Pelobates cultripes TaxID=61616 RepID=A0AAD1T5G7_PELCU|nr:Hypothetical predicted protein [Pelobates cultripes]